MTGLAVSTAIGVGLLVAASFCSGRVQGGLWIAAILLDFGGPYFFGAEGWKLVPEHFAERHGLIIIIALGESIVAIGVGSQAKVDAGVVAAAVLATGIVGPMWWLYFDRVALVAARRLANAAPGREQNEIARDSFSYMHLPMVAGIVLVALGFKKTFAHVEEPLKLVPEIALLGGSALYLLAHTAFRWRNVHRFSTERVIAAAVLLGMIPVGRHIEALVLLGLVTVVFTILVVYEHLAFREVRERVRHPAPDPAETPDPSPTRARP